ncbi:MAG: S-methyl-5-thioribose-1-phosphate isomerase [Eubacteriales bacterium]
MDNVLDISPVIYKDEKMLILDQTLLPNETLYLEMDSEEKIFEAISKLRVRGAPAIGIAAAYGVYASTKDFQTEEFDCFFEEFLRVKNYLASSRPTAVNLFWALNRMEARILMEKGSSIAEIKKSMLSEAHAIREEDENVCRCIGENALTLLRPGMGILTHCNAGTIATGKYGTALSAIYLGSERGYNFKVFADETRPLLQGARLTAWELHKAGIDITLICDNMAAMVMKSGFIDAIVVGCDRVAANGDTANKIGTLGLGILAKAYKIPLYVHAPISTIDLKTKTGADIEIEMRPGEEIYKMWFKKSMAPEGISTYNPAFDVTDHQYITAIITEVGICYPPYEESLAKAIKENNRNK